MIANVDFYLPIEEEVSPPSIESMISNRPVDACLEYMCFIKGGQAQL